MIRGCIRYFLSIYLLLKLWSREVQWSGSSLLCSLGVFLHRPHEACKCVICTAGDNRCAFLVSKPLKPAFDFPLLSAVHWYHLAEVESEWAGVERRGGEALHCLINHANDWWGVRGPLTCSQTPQSAILLRVQTQRSANHRWGWGKKKKGEPHRGKTQKWHTCAAWGHLKNMDWALLLWSTIIYSQPPLLS